MQVGIWKSLRKSRTSEVIKFIFQKLKDKIRTFFNEYTTGDKKREMSRQQERKQREVEREGRETLRNGKKERAIKDRL